MHVSVPSLRIILKGGDTMKTSIVSTWTKPCQECYNTHVVPKDCACIRHGIPCAVYEERKQK